MNPALVEQARHGDHDAFAVLAAVSVDDLYRIARLIVGDPGIAEDVVQETLLAAWVGLPRLREIDRYEAWLRRLLVRRCWKSRRQRRAIATEVGLLDIDRPTADDHERSLVVRDLLDRGFEHLATEDRALLVLHFYLDMSVPAIAETVGMREGTVKSRIHRASRRMRAFLDADDRAGVMTTGAAR